MWLKTVGELGLSSCSPAALLRGHRQKKKKKKKRKKEKKKS